MPTRREDMLMVLAGMVAVLVAVNKLIVAMITAMEQPSRLVVEEMSFEIDFHKKRVNLRVMIYSSDVSCFNQIRMYRFTFDKLCCMLETVGGLKPSMHLLVDEQVSMFLHILAHHVKNRVIQFEFGRSGETISRYFRLVLNATIKLQNLLLAKAVPIANNSNDNRWKWFKGCLGALDGTHIPVQVPAAQKGRYRNRKGQITTNVLGVCSPEAEFIFVFPGWEGSAADGRVLRDAISRPHGLRVPHGNYYLVDAGYTNCEGFLAPYRGQRYHLNDWREGQQPRTPHECFNMRHSSARNVIEWSFGLLKMRWGILRNPSFYPIKIQNRCIIACCLLHNLIRRENVSDPIDEELETLELTPTPGDFIPPMSMDTSNEWTAYRERLANDMFASFSARSAN